MIIKRLERIPLTFSDITKASLTKEMNKITQLSFSYPVATENGVRKNDILDVESVFDWILDNGSDTFDVTNVTLNNYMVTVTAHQIAYRLKGVIVTPFSEVTTAPDALDALVNHCDLQTGLGGTFTISYETGAVGSGSYELTTPKDAWTVLTEIADEFDFWLDCHEKTVTMRTKMQNEVTFSIGENMMSINWAEKTDGVSSANVYYNGVYAYYSKSNVYLYSRATNSAYSSDIRRDKVVNVTSMFDSEPSQEEVDEMAQTLANGVSCPVIWDISGNVADLWNGFSPNGTTSLTNYKIGDKAFFDISPYEFCDTSTGAKCIIKITYDLLLASITSIGFGDAYHHDLTTLLNDMLKKQESTETEIEQIETQISTPASSTNLGGVLVNDYASGLGVAESGELIVNAGAGLAVSDDNELCVNYGAGLVIGNSKLLVNCGDGMAIDDDGKLFVGLTDSSNWTFHPASDCSWQMESGYGGSAELSGGYYTCGDLVYVAFRVYSSDFYIHYGFLGYILGIPKAVTANSTAFAPSLNSSITTPTAWIASDAIYQIVDEEHAIGLHISTGSAYQDKLQAHISGFYLAEHES